MENDINAAKTDETVKQVIEMLNELHDTYKQKGLTYDQLAKLKQTAEWLLPPLLESVSFFHSYSLPSVYAKTRSCHFV